MAVRIPAPPSHRRPTPDHPPYAEMVRCALKTLAEPHGSTESSISTFIQANYTSLPWGHSKLLPYYLNKLLITGEVLRSKSDSNCYVLPGHSPSLRKKKRGRPKKRNSNSIVKMNVSENAVKERKGTILKFKRKCPEGDANASDGGWMFSDNKTHEQEDEALHGAECNERNNMLLALPAFKSSDTKMKDNGCNEKAVELQMKNVKGVEFDMQNETLLASDGTDFGDAKVDVNGKETTLQEKDYSAIKIDDNRKWILALQDKNCSLSVNAENGNGKDKDIGHMKIDVNGEKMLALEEKDCSTAKIDENDEVFVLQDKQCSLSAIVGGGNETLALQEKDMNGAELNKQSNNLFALKEKDVGGMKNDVDGEEMLGLQEKGRKGLAFNMQNENLLPLQKKDSGNMKIDVNGEQMSALQEKDMKREKFNMQIDNMIFLKEKGFGDIETNVNSEEMLVLQEKDTKGVELDTQNEFLFPLHENDTGDMKIDVNDDTAVLASKEKNCSATNIDENEERVSVLQDKDHSSSVIADNSNESSLHEGDLNVCKNEDKGSLLASLESVEELPHAVPRVEMDTPSKKTRKSLEANTSSKKSKPKKLRKLWFES